jgi:hypothetical protein
MKFLVEQYDTSQFSVVNEAADKKGLYITGPFIQMDVVNGNNRIYPSEYIPSQIDKYIVEKINTDRAVGELNHPNHPEVNYERACIKIVELTRQGSDYYGKAKVLESLPLGNIVAGLLREGVKIGVSSRALGSLKTRHDGVKIVQPDYRLMTAADVVSEPSAPDALVTAIMESKEWVFENGILKESETRNFVDKVSQGGMTATKLKMVFEEVIQTISSAKHK